MAPTPYWEGWAVQKVEKQGNLPFNPPGEAGIRVALGDGEVISKGEART